MEVRRIVLLAFVLCGEGSLGAFAAPTPSTATTPTVDHAQLDPAVDVAALYPSAGHIGLAAAIVPDPHAKTTKSSTERDSTDKTRIRAIYLSTDTATWGVDPNSLPCAAQRIRERLPGEGSEIKTPRVWAPDLSIASSARSEPPQIAPHHDKGKTGE